MTERPYPEAPLASRKAPLSEPDEGIEALQAMTAKAPGAGSRHTDERLCGLGSRSLDVSGSESRADPKPPPRYIDPEALKAFHAVGHNCLTCGYYRCSAHHLVSRAQGGDDVQANLIPLCGMCHGCIHSGGKWQAYGVSRTADAVRACIGDFLTSEAGEDHLRYVKAKLGARAGAFLERYGVEL